MKPAAFVLGLILAATTSTARTERVHNRTLSLEECTRIALEHNLGIQISKLDPQLAQFALSGSYANYDPRLSFGARHSYNLSPSGFTEENIPFGGTENEGDNINSAL